MAEVEGLEFRTRLEGLLPQLLKCITLQTDATDHEELKQKKTLNEVEEDSKELAEEDNKELAEEDNKELAEEDNKELAEEDNKELAEEDNKELAEEDNKELAEEDNKSMDSESPSTKDDKNDTLPEEQRIASNNNVSTYDHLLFTSLTCLGKTLSACDSIRSKEHIGVLNDIFSKHAFCNVRTYVTSTANCI